LNSMYAPMMLYRWDKTDLNINGTMVTLTRNANPSVGYIVVYESYNEMMENHPEVTEWLKITKDGSALRVIK